MKKTKLIVALLLAVMMIFTFALVACVQTEEPPKPQPDKDKSVTLKALNALQGGNAIESFKLSEILNIATNEWFTTVENTFRKAGWASQISLYNSFAGFPATASSTPTYATGTTLNAAIGYNNAATAMKFTASSSANARKALYPGMSATASNVGAFKPAWAELQNRLGITLNDIFLNKQPSSQIEDWITKGFVDDNGNKVDVTTGNLININEQGRAGNLINLMDYIQYMPNYKQFLIDNPMVYLSLLADTKTGAFYAMPYFDGNDDIERYFMARVDWMTQLLDGNSAYVKTSSSVNAMNTTVAYEAYMPTTGSVDIEVANAAGTAITTITKDYDAVLAQFKTESWYTSGTSGNIADISAAYRKSTGATYEGLVNVVRKYIDVAYSNHYGNNRSDLFSGVNAAWDADELVALLHCVIGSSYDLGDIPASQMEGIFARQSDDNQRRFNLVSLGSYLFGVRGMEARTGYYYFDSNGNLTDARSEIAPYEMSLKLNTMYQEGLILDPYITPTVNSTQLVKGTGTTKGLGFMMYDYCQTQTVLNTTKDSQGVYQVVADLEPIVNPVALWYDGTNVKNNVDEGVYMRFTESWRSVKTDASCITTNVLDANGNPTDKLWAALKMFDYFYTKDGKVLMTYGPDEIIELKAGAIANDTSNQDRWVTIDINGQQVPKIRSEITSDTSEYYYLNRAGSFTGYARECIGATFAVSEKMQAFEFQLTDARGVEGATKVSKNIALGLVKHPLLSIGSEGINWYTSLPSSIASTSNQDAALQLITTISTDAQYFHSGGGTTGTAAQRYCIFIAMITATVKDVD